MTKIGVDFGRSDFTAVCFAKVDERGLALIRTLTLPGVSGRTPTVGGAHGVQAREDLCSTVRSTERD